MTLVNDIKGWGRRSFFYRNICVWVKECRLMGQFDEGGLVINKGIGYCPTPEPLFFFVIENSLTKWQDCLRLNALIVWYFVILWLMFGPWCLFFFIISKNKHGKLSDLPFEKKIYFFTLYLKQFDALCKAEVAFFISRAFLNVSKNKFSLLFILNSIHICFLNLWIYTIFYSRWRCGV